MPTQIIIEESPISRFFFTDTRSAWFWTIVRLYVGWQWIAAGMDKISDPLWIGPNAGQALSGFVQSALPKTVGSHPDVLGSYAAFLQNIVLPHAAVWSQIVVYGELFVGFALIIGAFVGIATFFGLFMNLNYLLAGTVSINPVLFTLSVGLMLAWKVAGFFGLDRYLLPWLGTPWKRGELFKPLV